MLTNSFKFNYSIGAVANGIKTDTFTFFLLFFYSRVIGLDPLLAGTAIFIALLVDSVTDPLMGTISDRTRSRLGRRHPFMFAAFIPASIFYVLLFTPKIEWGLSQSHLFIWMLVCTTFTRVGMTLFEVPHRSFGAEIIKNYEGRTLLFSWRELITWVAAIGNAFMGYFIFFRSTPDYPYGQLNPEVWFPFALAGGVFMALGMLYSTISTTQYIKDLSTWNGPISLKDIFNEISIAISNRSFLIFFAGNLTLSIAWGLSNSLALYINTDFWELPGKLITIFLGIYITSTFIAFYLTPRLVKRFDKKKLVLLCIFGTAFFSPIAFISYNLGLTPEKGTLSLIFFLSVPLIFISCFSVMGNMTRDSMIGDIADEVELTSGRRQEGVLYSAVSFIQKVNTAIGGFVAGLVLKIVEYPKDNPTYEQTYSLFFVQGVVGPILLAIPLFIFFFYKLDRARHAKIIVELNATN